LPSLACCTGNPVRECVAPIAESAQTGVAALACLSCWQSHTRRCCAYSGICPRLPIVLAIPYAKALCQQRNLRKWMGAALAYPSCWQSRTRRHCANNKICARCESTASLTSRAGNPAREGVAPTVEFAQTGGAALACLLHWQSRKRRRCANSEIRANGWRAALACLLCWQSRTRRRCAYSGIRANGCGLPSLTSRAGNPVREGVAPIAESVQTGWAALAYQPRRQFRTRRHCDYSEIRANGFGCLRLPVVLAISHEKVLSQQRNPRKRVWLPRLPAVLRSRTRRYCVNSEIRANGEKGIALAYPSHRQSRKRRRCDYAESAQTGGATFAYLLCWQSRTRRRCTNSEIRANGFGCPRLPVVLAIPYEKALRLQRNPRKWVWLPSPACCAGNPA
jgi:hypothetical protein